jgi:hypothetical protein
MAATSRQTQPWRLSVSYNERRRIGSCFSKTIVAIRSEKSISIIGFEKGKLLNLRCACHGRCLAHNRSISRNARSDTLDPCIKSSWLSIVQMQLPSFPFGCYTTPYYCKTVILCLPLIPFAPKAQYTRFSLSVNVHV